MGRDVAKIGKALERPGIDPRKFVELAVITAVAVDGNGVHADVLTAEGLPETVALAPPYAGPGYGFYGPLELDDAVLIAMPDGKYNAGGRIVGKLWDEGSPPPAEVADHPDDVALVVKPGQTIRIVVSGGGNAVIEARDGGTVLVGGEDASDPPLGRSDGIDLLAAITAALATAPTTGAQALAALLSALQNIPAPLVPTAGANPEHVGQQWPVGAGRVRIL